MKKTSKEIKMSKKIQKEIISWVQKAGDEGLSVEQIRRAITQFRLRNFGENIDITDFDFRRQVLHLVDNNIIDETPNRRLVAGVSMPKPSKAKAKVEVTSITKLKELKRLIDAAVKAAGKLDPDVEVWHDDELYFIDSVRQFSVTPDVSILITKVE